MGLNKSKKLAKKSVKPAPVVDEDEIEELDEVEEIEEEEEEVPVKKSKRCVKSSKAAKPAPVVDEDADDDADDADDDADDDSDDSDDADDVSFDTESVIKGIVSDKRNLTSAVYQVQLRLPAEIEPVYKALSPRLKKALRDAFAELVKKAYDQTH